jgi:hypothetical protein
MIFELWMLTASAILDSCFVIAQRYFVTFVARQQFYQNQMEAIPQKEEYLLIFL